MSRQLWWGHRIPAYFVRIVSETHVDRNDPANSTRWVVARTQAEALKQASERLGVAEAEIILG